MPDVPLKRRELWLRLALAGEVILFLAHGAVLAARAPWPVETLAQGRAFSVLLAPLTELGVSAEAAIAGFGAAAGSASILLLAAFAAGTEGLRLPALVPPLLLAASPVFAHAAFTGGEEAVFASLILATGYRALTETHTAGRLPISALCCGLAAAFGRAGFWVLIALFLQRIAFARKFRLRREVVLFAVIWLALALAVAGATLLALGAGGAAFGEGAGRPAGVPAGGAGPADGATLVFALPVGNPLLAGWRTLGAFAGAVNGLALLPFVLALLLAWKPKEVYFRLTLAGAVLAALLAVACQAPAAGLWRVLAPALPWGFLIAGEGLAHAATVLQSTGLRGRAGTILGVGVVAALVFAELAPTLAGSVE